MIDLASSLETELPIEAAFEFVITLENRPRYLPILKQYLPAGGASAVGVGTAFREVTQVMGRTVELAFEVIEFEAPRRFAYRATDGPIRGHFAWTFEPVGGGTRVTIAGSVEAAGLLKSVAAAFERDFPGQIATDAATLRQVLAGADPAAG